MIGGLDGGQWAAVPRAHGRPWGTAARQVLASVRGGQEDRRTGGGSGRVQERWEAAGFASSAPNHGNYSPHACVQCAACRGAPTPSKCNGNNGCSWVKDCAGRSKGPAFVRRAADGGVVAALTPALLPVAGDGGCPLSAHLACSSGSVTDVVVVFVVVVSSRRQSVCQRPS